MFFFSSIFTLVKSRTACFVGPFFGEIKHVVVLIVAVCCYDLDLGPDSIQDLF